MPTVFTLGMRDRRSLFRCCLLIFLWILGLVVGIWSAISTQDLHYLLVSEVISVSSTFVGLIFVFGVPFVLCAVGIVADLCPVTCVAVLLESFSRGFCGFGVYLFCGTGAWLLRLLILFSSIVCSVIVWRLILRYCLYGKIRAIEGLRTITILMFLCISVDRMLIAPFLMRLSMYI